MSITYDHEVILTEDIFHIISADTEFYNFIATERIYIAMDHIVVKEDQERFRQQCLKADGSNFFVRLYDKYDKAVLFFACVVPAPLPEQLLMRLVNIEKIVEQGSYFRDMALAQADILKLYGDRFFIYDPKKDTLDIISYDGRWEDGNPIPLDKVQDKLLSATPEDKQNAVYGFIHSLRSGEIEFHYSIESDCFGFGGAKNTEIAGTSRIKEGKHVRTTGFIHSGGAVNPARKQVQIDALTGLIAKNDITNMAIEDINVKKRKDITICVIDVDNFKKVNDTYGHMEGDEVLKTVASIMKEQVGNSGKVGRIGGDEFFAIFYDADDMEHMRGRLRSIKNMVNVTYPGGNGKVPVTLSFGCAAYPKDADNFEDLFKLADFAVYRAKEKGRNRYIIYDKEKHGTLEEIKSKSNAIARIDNRGNKTTGDIICQLMTRVAFDATYNLDKLLDDMVVSLNIQRIMLYEGENPKVVKMAGERRPTEDVLSANADYVSDADFLHGLKKYTSLELGEGQDQIQLGLINDVHFFEDKSPIVYRKMENLEIQSLLEMRFVSESGIPRILSLQSVQKRVTWNDSNKELYKLLALIVAKY